MKFVMSDTPLAIIILAAGMGTRMKSDKPKVLHEVAGKPMINWVLDSALKLKPQKIITVIGPDMPALKKAVAPHETVIQKDRNGTGGAVKCALNALKDFKGDVVILLGDCPLITSKTLKGLIKARSEDLLTELSVLSMELEEPKGYGRLITNKDGYVTAIIEEKDAKAKEKAINLVNAGAFCVNSEKLSSWIGKIDSDNAQNEYYLTDIVKIASKEGVNCASFVCKTPSELKGCNSRADLAEIESIFQDNTRNSFMAAGVTMLEPNSVHFHHDTKIAQDCIIEPNVFFGPAVKLEKGVHIKAYSYLEDCIIRSEATIGPFARIRPGTDIGSDARIGNFVEIKKSKIGKGSKIGHLAYVGDTIMGEDVNFSAGAITVNYDGFQKHQTIIGKNVMVGSNVNLVAPVAIDDGAFIAAGSTITEDVPADALSIARDVAEVRQGWAAKYRKLKAAALAKKKRSKAS